MRKTIWVLTVAILCVIAKAGYEKLADKMNIPDSKSEKSVEQVVGEVFQSEGLKESVSQIDTFFYVGTYYLSEQEKLQQLQNIAIGLGVRSDCTYETNKTENGWESILRKEGANSDVELKWITVEIPEGENLASLRQYLSASITVDNSISSGMYYKRRLEEVTSTMSEHLITTSIEGTVKGNLSKEGQKKIADRILKSMAGALVMECEMDDGAVNVYGYTDDVDEVLCVGNDKININVTYSYDEEKDETTIYVATPLLNYDY